MEQQQTIRSTFEKNALINHLPVEFSLENRRNIKFKYPSIEELLSELDLQLFLTMVGLNKKKIEEAKILVNFPIESRGEIISNFIAYTDYGKVLKKYFKNYIDKCEEKDDGLYVDDLKINSKEYEHIAWVILVSCGAEQVDDKDIGPAKKVEKLTPEMEEILKKQKEAEEKLNRIKQKKAKNSGFTIEQIMLAITYEFAIPMKDLIKLNYYALFWYFSFVGRVDSHKLNQLIISSGFSKKKDYSYWLNK
jgi:hypothetical protein